MNLFVYGTLMVPAVMSRVTGRTFRGRSAVLRGYARLTMRDRIHPGLVRFPDLHVDGVVFFDVDEASRARIAQFEGDLYRRVEVTVETDDGRWIEAETYLLRAPARKFLTAAAWKEEEFLKHLDEFLGSCPGVEAPARST